jgi:TRAP-type C4-dicarboxylate transport system substrate-binding protein
MRRFAAVSLTLALGLSVAQGADAKTKVRFSTLAPKNSSWGKVFAVWEKAVVKKTHGEIELDVYYNGVQGMEDSMVGKMKTGQLDGAALTTLGLSKINKNIMAMTLPWVINSWEKLDKVRPVIAPQFEKEFAADGFQVLGWGDVGLVYGFAKGFAVQRPENVRGHRPLVWRNEPVGPIVFSLIGQITPVPLSVTEVLPALRAGTIDMLSAPALAAEQLQWTPHLDHVTSEPVVTAIGATVFRKQSIAAMPADLRDVFLKMQKRVGESQNKRIRKLDLEAYNRMKKRMTVVKVTGEDRKAWEAIARKSLKRLSQGVFPKALMRKVADLAGIKNAGI